MLFIDANIAKVGVEGSNPFARSRISAVLEPAIGVGRYGTPPHLPAADPNF